MSHYQDGDYLRTEFKGRAMKRKGRKVHHHPDCEANMCNGRPFCRRLDEHGGARLIESPSAKGACVGDRHGPTCHCNCTPSAHRAGVKP